MISEIQRYMHHSAQKKTRFYSSKKRSKPWASHLSQQKDLSFFQKTMPWKTDLPIWENTTNQRNKYWRPTLRSRWAMLLEWRNTRASRMCFMTRTAWDSSRPSSASTTLCSSPPWALRNNTTLAQTRLGYHLTNCQSTLVCQMRYETISVI